MSSDEYADRDSPAIDWRSAVASAIIWAIRLYLLLVIAAVILTPPFIAFSMFGVRGALFVGLIVLAVCAFLTKFGPYLIAMAIGKMIMSDVQAQIEELEENGFQTPHLDALRNHATAEGIKVWYL